MGTKIMKNKMSVIITVFGKMDGQEMGSRKLYDELAKYHVNVIDLGDKTYVRFITDINHPTLDAILQVCHKYGNLDVSITSV